ncbi:hypothetical protein C0J52_11631 [Blattella germanica]|nr:hypothetical protein C0J52_11631 [Blattella germanica]
MLGEDELKLSDGPMTQPLTWKEKKKFVDVRDYEFPSLVVTKNMESDDKSKGHDVEGEGRLAVANNLAPGSPSHTSTQETEMRDLGRREPLPDHLRARCEMEWDATEECRSHVLRANSLNDVSFSVLDSSSKPILFLIALANNACKNMSLITALPLRSDGAPSLPATEVLAIPVSSSSPTSHNLSSKSTSGCPGTGSWVRYERSYILRFLNPPRLLLPELLLSLRSLTPLVALIALLRNGSKALSGAAAALKGADFMK